MTGPTVPAFGPPIDLLTAAVRAADAVLWHLVPDLRSHWWALQVEVTRTSIGGRTYVEGAVTCCGTVDATCDYSLVASTVQ